MNIDFKKIKRLSLYRENIYNKLLDDNMIQKHFFETLFQVNNIENNLVYLKMYMDLNKINPFLFENINKFKTLKYLYIYGLYFEKDFIIK